MFCYGTQCLRGAVANVCKRGRVELVVKTLLTALALIALESILFAVHFSEPGFSEMVSIAGASFEMGIDPVEIDTLSRLLGVGHRELFADEMPKHRVSLASFAIDRYEVTNAQFEAFVATHPEWSAGVVDPPLRPPTYLRGWTGPPGNGGNVSGSRSPFPVVYVTWYAATAYCAARGDRLPTEAEWEYAARGGLVDRLFPWGDEAPDASRANYSGSHIGGAAPVGSYPPNGYGLFDMAGNVWEFVADQWERYPSLPQNNPVAGGVLRGDGYLSVKTRRVIRGGSWGGAPVNLWTGYRDSHPPDHATDFVGFRCARFL